MTSTQTLPTFGVVILAAGASSRMGRPKLLLPWGKTTIVGHLISQWRGLGAAQIAIVQRPDDFALAAELNRLDFPKTERIANPQPARGMFSSVVCAAKWEGWQKNISTWAIALGDQPHLRGDTLRQLLEFAVLHADAICQPAYNGRTAHPVMLPRAAFEALRDTQAGTLKDFLNLGVFPSVKHVINDPGLTLDLDTPEDYIQAQGSILAV